MQVFYFYRKKGESFHLIIEFNKFITYQNKKKIVDNNNCNRKSSN